MKTAMKLLALVMAMMMVLCMVACGNDTPSTTEPSTEPTASTGTTGTTEPEDTKPTDDGKKEYKIYVVDSDNNPVAGVMVQICIDDSCNPKKTDENGVATYRLTEGTNYTAGITKNYEETKVYLEDKFEVTLVYDPPVAE